MKPLLLDLFSGAGGAGEGYRRAGFEVIGVDWKMRRQDLSQAIPPAYTHHIGRQLYEHISKEPTVNRRGHMVYGIHSRKENECYPQVAGNVSQQRFTQ